VDESYGGPRKIKDRGAIQGELTLFTPFLYLSYAGVGMSTASNLLGGEYLIGCSAGDGYSWHGGFILPIAEMRDPELRRLSRLAFETEELCERFEEVFGVEVKGEGPARRVEADQGFYRRLRGQASFVSEISDPMSRSESNEPFLDTLMGSLNWSRRRDDSRPHPIPAKVERLEGWRWGSYGEIAEELFYGREGLYSWPHLSANIVFGDTSRLPSRLSAWEGQGQLSRPTDRFDWLFQLSTQAPHETPVIRFRMGEVGWAYLYVAHRAQVACSKLSQVYDPFLSLAAWGLAIAEDDLPVEVVIDEEGHLVYLSAYRTSDADRIAVFVEDIDRRVLLRCAPNRAQFAEELRKEMRRFFESEFDPQEWHLGVEGGDPPFPTRELVLDHPFLKG
jgi:hypothetical protein